MTASVGPAPDRPASPGELRLSPPVSAPAGKRSREKPAARARAEWEHDFRNALGNITISAGAAASHAAAASDPLLAGAIAEIEKGCSRCLQLLRTMPR